MHTLPPLESKNTCESLSVVEARALHWLVVVPVVERICLLLCAISVDDGDDEEQQTWLGCFVETKILQIQHISDGPF